MLKRYWRINQWSRIERNKQHHLCCYLLYLINVKKKYEYIGLKHLTKCNSPNIFRFLSDWTQNSFLWLWKTPNLNTTSLLVTNSCGPPLWFKLFIELIILSCALKHKSGILKPWICQVCNWPLKPLYIDTIDDPLCFNS